MNSLLNLGRYLGDVSSTAFQRSYHYQLIQSLDHQDIVTFSYLKREASRSPGASDDDSEALPAKAAPSIHAAPIAHQAGTNCLAIDPQAGRYLITGGADSTIRLWDLEQHSNSQVPNRPCMHEPVASLSRSLTDAHTHAITSTSVYPFDPVPTTLLSTSYDKSLLLSSITPTSLQPIHKINLDFTPYTHTISPHPSSTPLVAVGTSHPAIRLIDLRTGLSTHSLPGHNGAVYALTFSPSPSHPHLLISGSADGRILLFDIRRANPAFASLDLDDPLGFPTSLSTSPSESRPITQHLNYASQAHAGPVTGLAFVPSDPTTLVSAGHDSRLRTWDLSTGRNNLIHFGQRIRNSRPGHLSPVILPASTGVKPGQEVLLWPNDDHRGEIFMHSAREGTMLRILKTKGVDRSNVGKASSSSTGSSTPALRGNKAGGAKGQGGRPNAIISGSRARKGKINALALRPPSAESGSGIEIYSAHADGSVCVWRPEYPVDQDDDEKLVFETDEGDGDAREDGAKGSVLTAEQSSRKRKRDLIGDLVAGLGGKKGGVMTM